MDITLLRIIDSLERPTLGVLFHYGVPLWTTLEPPNKHNVPFLSCIPAGVYRCEPKRDVKIGETVYPITFEVMTVAGRSGIYFHVGNYKEDTHGCILVGKGFNQIGITESKLGFSDFVSTITNPNDQKLRYGFSLTIRFAR